MTRIEFVQMYLCRAVLPTAFATYSPERDAFRLEHLAHELFTATEQLMRGAERDEFYWMALVHHPLRVCGVGFDEKNVLQAVTDAVKHAKWRAAKAKNQINVCDRVNPFG